MVVDFATDPLLGVYGDDHHGKSTFITNVVGSIVAGRRSPNEAIIIFFDPKRRQRRGDPAAGRARSGR